MALTAAVSPNSFPQSARWLRGTARKRWSRDCASERQLAPKKQRPLRLVGRVEVGDHHRVGNHLDGRFQVITIGRFWAITEVFCGILAILRYNLNAGSFHRVFTVISQHFSVG
jgi:hypothetical protein